MEGTPSLLSTSPSSVQGQESPQEEKGKRSRNRKRDRKMTTARKEKLREKRKETRKNKSKRKDRRPYPLQIVAALRWKALRNRSLFNKSIDYVAKNRQKENAELTEKYNVSTSNSSSSSSSNNNTIASSRSNILIGSTHAPVDVGFLEKRIERLMDRTRKTFGPTSSQISALERVASTTDKALLRSIMDVNNSSSTSIVQRAKKRNRSFARVAARAITTVPTREQHKENVERAGLLQSALVPVDSSSAAISNWNVLDKKKKGRKKRR